MKQVLSERQELVYNWFDFVLLFTRKSHPTHSSNPKASFDKALRYLHALRCDWLIWLSVSVVCNCNDATALLENVTSLNKMEKS